MAKRVKFKDENGKVKNMEKALAMRLEAREKGKIIGDIVTKEQELAKREKALVAKEKELAKREKAIEAKEKELAKREKALAVPSNKVDKQAKAKENK